MRKLYNVQLNSPKSYSRHDIKTAGEEKKNPTARYAVNRGKNKANILEVLYLSCHSNCKKISNIETPEAFDRILIKTLLVATIF